MSVDIEKYVEKYVEKSDTINIIDDIFMSPIEDYINLNFMFGNNALIRKIVEKQKYKFLYTKGSFIITYTSTGFNIIKGFIKYGGDGDFFWEVDFILAITSENLEKAIRHFVLNISKANKAKFIGMDRFAAKYPQSYYHINKEY